MASTWPRRIAERLGVSEPVFRRTWRVLAETGFPEPITKRPLRFSAEAVDAWFASRPPELPSPSTMMVPLTRGQIAWVDVADWPKVAAHRWRAVPWSNGSGKFYAVSTIRDGETTRRIWLHRVVMDDPEGLLVDHINGDGLDCRRSNLRACTQGQNNRNRRLKTKSGYQGVQQRDGQWFAKVGRGKARRWIGPYTTAREAALAYDLMADLDQDPFRVRNFHGAQPGALQARETLKRKTTVHARPQPIRTTCYLGGKRLF